MENQTTIEDLMSRYLPKRSGLIVVGEPVTELQAMLILVRTDSFNFSSNDLTFQKQINKILYDVDASYIDLRDALAKKHGVTPWESWDITDKIIEKYGVISLDCMCNHRVTSAWVGGPHVWCDWDGKIGSTCYNVGKYPDIEKIYEECRRIAESFHFLNMKIQLLDRETCEDRPKPVVEIHIKDGSVSIHEPNGLLAEPTEPNYNFHIRTEEGMERGCTIEKFQEALEAVLFMDKVEKTPDEIFKTLKPINQL